MKSPSRRLRRLVGAGTAALLAVGLAPILTSGVAQAASTNTPAIAVANQTVIGVGQSGSAAGDCGAHRAAERELQHLWGRSVRRR